MHIHIICIVHYIHLIYRPLFASESISQSYHIYFPFFILFFVCTFFGKVYYIKLCSEWLRDKRGEGIGKIWKERKTLRQNQRTTITIYGYLFPHASFLFYTFYKKRRHTWHNSTVMKVYTYESWKSSWNTISYTPLNSLSTRHKNETMREYETCETEREKKSERDSIHEHVVVLIQDWRKKMYIKNMCIPGIFKNAKLLFPS